MIKQKFYQIFAIKQIFWQTSINDQKPKLKIQIKDIASKGLVDTGADVTIRHPNWPSQEVNVQFWEWNVISGKTEHEMGQMYRARMTERKIKAICG